MNYKAIRIISYLSGLFSAVLIVLWMWVRSGGDTPDIQAAVSIALRTSALAFFFIALLAANVATIVENQADEIAALKRDRREL